MAVLHCDWEEPDEDATRATANEDDRAPLTTHCCAACATELPPAAKFCTEVRCTILRSYMCRCAVTIRSRTGELPRSFALR